VQTLRIALVGFGVVGQSLAKLFLLKEQEFANVYGMKPNVICIIDRNGLAMDDKGLNLRGILEKKRRTGTVGRSKGEKPNAVIIKSTDADVLVETTPTNFKSGEPGLSHIKAAFQAKMSVVTANKGPLAVAFQALMELARHNNVFLRFSGAVGGGTPILDFGKSCSRGDTLIGIEGILNSTTNFILTNMERQNLSFEEALKSAQKHGYAEADPSLDIDGFDSAVKLVIIVNYLTKRAFTVRDVKITGIREVSIADVQRARDKGKAIRLIASANERLSVEPRLIDRDDPMCVSGPYNAVKFFCKNSGEKVIVGKGAGGMETASSIIRDMLEIRDLLAGRGLT
jgi:homoserine dehydrogenase